MSRENRMGAMVRILCAMALLCVGFAHKPPVIEKPALSASELALYTLPDGTLPDLCLNDGDDVDGRHRHDAGCDACRLAASVLLPLPPDTAETAFSREPDHSPPDREIAWIRPALSSSAGPRAPPVRNPSV